MASGGAIALAGMLLVAATMYAAEPEAAGQAQGDQQGLAGSQGLALEASQSASLCPSNSVTLTTNTVSASQQANQGGKVESGQTDKFPKDNKVGPLPPVNLRIVGSS